MANAQLVAPFQREIFADFVPESGLLVLAKGLGLFQIVKAFVELYASPKMLVFLLGATQQQENALLNFFTGGEEQLIGHVPFKIIKNDTLAKDRLEMYLQGGVISITNRIMLIDILKERLPVHLTTGVLLLHAHHVTEFGLEAFILDLFKSQNQVGFIKAFCDQAEALTGAYSKVEKTLKFLKVPKLLLYPRFHVTVKSDLDNVKVTVEELYVSMTPKMKMIQLGLLEIMETCLNELVRANPSLDVKEFNMESAVTEVFDRKIQRQLDPIWHRVSLKSKQLIGELYMMRILLEYLVKYDPITFCKFVETIIMADMTQSGTGGFRSYWLMLESAQSVIKTVKDRVFTIGTDGKVTPSIESMPKWKVLEGTLEQFTGKKVVIMVKEENTRQMLIKIIASGFTEWQKAKYDEFISWKSRARQQGGFSLGVPISNTTTGDITGSGVPTSSLRGRIPAAAGHRKGTRGTKRPAIIERPSDGDDNAVVDNSQNGKGQQVHLGMIDQVEECVIPANYKVICYSDTDDYQNLLTTHSPGVVIMYDGQLEFIRALELYAHCESLDENVNIIMLGFQDSVEEQLQLLAIRQEKEAFENLIKIKSVILLYKFLKLGRTWRPSLLKAFQ